MNRETFEREFHSRTLAYRGAYRADARPVVVHLDHDTDCPAGHVLLVGLVNQLARAHQHVALTGPLDGPLRSPAPFGATTIADATTGLAVAINPFITISTDVPVGTDAVAHIALGRAATGRPVDVRVGCEGWCATFGDDARIGQDRTSTLGAMLASCLTAGYAFHRLLGSTAAPAASYSLWDFGAPGAGPGPPLDGPLDIGRVLQAGAGGVGASLDFWATFVGTDGTWTIGDGDIVDVSNLNRQLAFLARHAGYPDSAAVNKAIAAAHLLGPNATADPHWYGDSDSVVNADYDVVLALANEHGVRHALQQRQPPVLLHATTSPNWQAEFHRHIAGRDDCITCRIPGDAPVTACAQTRVDRTTRSDAALPFLSGAAGLLLLAGLLRLQCGKLADTQRNHNILNLADGNALGQALRRRCARGCRAWASPDIRRRVAAATRYAQLDPARNAA